MPKADVNNWENGKLLPTGVLIAKMDKVLGVRLPRPAKNWKTMKLNKKALHEAADEW